VETRSAHARTGRGRKEGPGEGQAPRQTRARQRADVPDAGGHRGQGRHGEDQSPADMAPLAAISRQLARAWNIQNGWHPEAEIIPVASSISAGIASSSQVPTLTHIGIVGLIDTGHQNAHIPSCDSSAAACLNLCRNHEWPAPSRHETQSRSRACSRLRKPRL
jgi:hypothetical protein